MSINCIALYIIIIMYFATQLMSRKRGKKHRKESNYDTKRI